MSINTEAYVERKWLHKETDINNPPSITPKPFNNQFVARRELVNPALVAYAGRYEKVLKVPEPVKPWHRAIRGTTDKFRGCLTEIFPELKDLTDKELKEIEKMRDRSE